MIAGFNFSKILVEKKSPIKGKLEIGRDLLITNLKEEVVQPDRKAVVVTFDFNVVYEPKIANIEIGGNLLYLTDDAKEIVSEWKKTKKLANEKFAYDIVNLILAKCNVKSLQLSEEMNLPPTIKLPRVTAKEEQDKSFAG